MSNYAVYMHISPSGKRYIGITSKKKAEYRWNNGKGYERQLYFYRAIEKYGWDNIEHIIIAKGLDEKTAKWLEIELIRVNNTTNPNKGYNITLGGDGSIGRCGELHPMFGLYGELNPNYGRTVSEEFKQRISEINKGRLHTEEWKQEHSERMSGKGNSKATLYKVINSNGEIVGVFCGKEIYNDHSKGFLNINKVSFNKYIKPFENININRLQSNHYKIKQLKENLAPFDGWQFIEISKEELETEVA